MGRSEMENEEERRRRWRAEREEMSSFSLYQRNDFCLLPLTVTSCPPSLPSPEKETQRGDKSKVDEP